MAIYDYNEICRRPSAPFESTDAVSQREDSLVVRGRLELGVDLLHALHEAVALLLQLAAGAVLARVQPLAVRRVDRLRRRGPATRQREGRPGAASRGRTGGPRVTSSIRGAVRRPRSVRPAERTRPWPALASLAPAGRGGATRGRGRPPLVAPRGLRLGNLVATPGAQGRGRGGGGGGCEPLLDVGGDAEVAGAQLAADLLDLQLHCKGTG